MILTIRRTQIGWLFAGVLFMGCAKVHDKKLASAATPVTKPDQTTPAAPTPPNSGSTRARLYSVLSEPPPVATNDGGERVLFRGIDTNDGNCYQSATGTFNPCRTAFYDIQAAIKWPASRSQQSAGICQIFLNVNGAPFPGAMATAPYLPGQPCTAQLGMKLVLEQGQPLFITAGVSATGVQPAAAANQSYGFISISEDP